MIYQAHVSQPSGAPSSSGASTPLQSPSRAAPSRHPVTDPRALTIDCGRCVMRDLRCGDCMVTALLGGPPVGVALDEAEQRALGVLADAGLLSPLRMVEPMDSGL